MLFSESWKAEAEASFSGSPPSRPPPPPSPFKKQYRCLLLKSKGMERRKEKTKQKTLQPKRTTV